MEPDNSNEELEEDVEYTPVDEYQKRAEEAAARLLKSFDTVLSFPEGVLVLQHIMNLTGYQLPCQTLNPASMEINVHASLANLAKRDLWLEIRKQIEPKSLAILENGGE